MSEQYSHRNGEMEPPVELGPYWVDIERDNEFLGILRIHWVYCMAGSQQRLVELKQYDDVATNVEDVRARWWGPIHRPSVDNA